MESSDEDETTTPTTKTNNIKLSKQERATALKEEVSVGYFTSVGLDMESQKIKLTNCQALMLHVWAKNVSKASQLE